MDFVKREEPGIDEENYRLFMENLQKTHQMESSEYQHTPISMEQLHHAMQSSLNASSLVHNFQLPLSPRQMSTLMLKTNQLSRNLNFNEIPAHLPRNLSSDIDLVHSLINEMPLQRHEELILNQNIGRSLDLNFGRTINNEIDLQNHITQNIVQNLSEQDLLKNIELNQNLSRLNESVLAQNLNPELELSNIIRQNAENDFLHNETRRAVGQCVQNQLEQNMVHRIEQGLAQRLDQRLTDNQRQLMVAQENHQQLSQTEHVLPMPFQIKLEQDDDYYYRQVDHNVDATSGVNGHIPVNSQPQHSVNLPADNLVYSYSNQVANANLNPGDLYSRSLNYIPSYVNNKENPQNLVIHRQYDYVDNLKKNKQIENKIDNIKNDEPPKENLKPTDQNKIFFSEYNQNLYENNDTKSGDKSPDLSNNDNLVMNIKGEYPCYKCTLVFPTKRDLKQHTKSCIERDNIEDKERVCKFSCTQCTYKCQSPAILKIHERTHSGEKPFSCTFCDYKSGQKNNVAKHILVHMKEKPFRCQYCDYRCAQKNNLVVHERTHTGYKPFACPYCDYRTVQKPNLVKHMYLHTDQKPFSCDICSYRCVQKTNLTKHKQRHLNDKEGGKVDVKIQNRPYKPRQKCPHCLYRCIQKSSLDKHIQFKHPDFYSIETNGEGLNLMKNDEQNGDNNSNYHNDDDLSADDDSESYGQMGKSNDIIQGVNLMKNCENPNEGTIQNLSVKKHSLYSDDNCHNRLIEPQVILES